MRSEAQEVGRVSLRILIATVASERSSMHEQHEQFIGEFDRLLEDYSKLVSSAEERRLFDSIKTAWERYLDEDKRVEAFALTAYGGSLKARSEVSEAWAKSLRTLMGLIVSAPVKAWQPALLLGRQLDDRLLPAREVAARRKYELREVWTCSPPAKAVCGRAMMGTSARGSKVISQSIRWGICSRCTCARQRAAARK